MGSSAKFHDDGTGHSWAPSLHGHEHNSLRIDERPISMMMTELPLGFCMILGGKEGAHLGKKEPTSGRSP